MQTFAVYSTPTEAHLAITRLESAGIQTAIRDEPAMPERYADIARALGVAAQADAGATTEAGLARLAELSRECGVPQRLRDVGIPQAAPSSCAGGG
jgi:alcohol dehydrogenase class IV